MYVFFMRVCIFCDPSSIRTITTASFLLLSFLNIFFREFDETESELLNKLSTSYGILDGQLISGSPRSLGGPEVQAKLWGHLVDALSSDAVGRIVHSYPNLVKFFNDATHQIFQSSSQVCMRHFLWIIYDLLESHLLFMYFSVFGHRITQ